MHIGRKKMWGVLVLALLLVLVWFRPLDTVAEQYTESGLKRAFATFAAARAMNATISVLQSIQVGAGASIQLGAVLDPIDDLERQPRVAHFRKENLRRRRDRDASDAGDRLDNYGLERGDVGVERDTQHRHAGDGQRSLGVIDHLALTDDAVGHADQLVA